MVPVKKSTTQQHGMRKWLALPLLVLGLLLVPLVLLPAHALPGHAATMSMSNSANAHHGEPGGHAHDHDTHLPALSDSAVTSHEGSDRDHGAPYCDAGPDFSAAAPSRPLNTPPELGFLLLALAFAAASVAALLAEPAWAPHLRHWFSRPPWRTSGISFLHFACIART
ncbi:hypothetical protein [Saccharopolyspora endophytica]|uniref:Uncharacterized protein n=1 Tax=Saccharopolyspora endophytica TaxID=543886 RepID=A0ABS5DQV6_9PSEU|nr:hypothetical protein [Saccharopolyspora endophytica]MBQ0928652.1 hypothetical protein [Saccharopolyspora endophytica]